MADSSFDELYSVFSRKDLSEVGGAHNQKGIEFQRHWAIMKMVSLYEAGKTDFLFLFEAFQDIAILDSDSTPSSIQIYQIKKKDRNEWTWTELTKLGKPKKASRSGKKKRVEKPLIEVKGSPIGKLYAVVKSFKTISGTGYFLSNAGCDLPTCEGTSFANSACSPLSILHLDHLELLISGLETLHDSGESKPDTSKVFVEKVPIPVDDPGTYVVGFVHEYLRKISPRHAGQARALVDSLLATIGPLGAKTATCNNFDEVKKQRGYSRKDLSSAFGSLETLPDLESYLQLWLNQLQSEGMSIMEVTAIRAAAASIFRRQVMASLSEEENLLHSEILQWSGTNPVPSPLLPFFRMAFAEIGRKHTAIREPEFYAHFSLKVIQQCADQISKSSFGA